MSDYSNDELLVHGYIRSNANKCNKSKKLIIPSDIMDLCLLWYYIECGWWKSGDLCLINRDQNIIHYIGAELPHHGYGIYGEEIVEPNSCYCSIAMPSVTETDIEFVYKLKIIKCEDEISIGICSTNGDYINDDFSRQTASKNYSYWSGSCSFDWKTNRPLERKKRGGWVGWTYGSVYRKGDIITMNYNPYHSTLRFATNDHYHGYIKVVEEIGLQYRLAIYLGEYGTQSVELIAYELISQDDDESVENQITIAAAAIDTNDGDNDFIWNFNVNDNNNDGCSYMVVPTNYICFKCKHIGDHWIMDCLKLKTIK